MVMVGDQVSPTDTSLVHSAGPLVLFDGENVQSDELAVNFLSLLDARITLTLASQESVLADAAVEQLLSSSSSPNVASITALG